MSEEKKDACYHKVKSRYKKWPSAYASGALVQCRKKGAKNWGNSTDEALELEEVELIPGGLTADLEGSMEEKHQALADKHNVSVEEINDQVTKGVKVELEHTTDEAIAHEIAMDHVFEDPKYYDKLAKVEGGSDEAKEKTTFDEAKRKKAGTESSKESNLRDWFKRKGAKGSKGGWVDCNSPDGKGGYKACGRGEGEKRKRYPACRPTPAACKERGKGKSWGKKDSKSRNENLQRIIREEAERTIFGKTLSEGLRFHIHNDISIVDNIYRRGTDKYFSLINETRDLWKAGKLNLVQEDIDLLETDLGEFATFGGERVPLDFPMMIDDTLDEAKKKAKKDPPIGKPMKNTGGGKKYKVYVRGPSGRIKKITYGDAKGGLKGNWNNAEARKNFASRHNCADKKDRTKAGYWACRAHKDFGTNVPGRFW